jgi:hypothetical protein
MGFFDNLWSGIKNVGKAVYNGARNVIGKVSDGVSYISRGIGKVLSPVRKVVDFVSNIPVIGDIVNNMPIVGQGMQYVRKADDLNNRIGNISQTVGDINRNLPNI